MEIRHPSKTREKPNKRPSMQEVAEAAGVSRSTVSSVLNNRPDCFASQATRQAVRRAIEKLGYRPNLNAKSLAKGRSMTLGVALNGVNIDPVTRTFESFEFQARSRGYYTLATYSPNDAQIEASNLCWLEDRGADGVLCIPTEYGRHEHLLEMKRRGLAVATYDAARRLGLPIDDVSIDHFAGGRMIAEHLLSLGRRRVCIAQFAHLCWVVEQRIAGIQSVMREAGLPPAELLSLSVEAAPQGCWSDAGQREIHAFFDARRGEVDAVAAVGDIIAHGIGGVLRRDGWDIPSDIAVAGYDGSVLSASPLLPLTTAHNPADDAGRIAVEMLMEQMSGADPDRAPRQVELTPKLIVRESTAGSAASP